MTYNDIYKKFLIQYDKADIMSSYPNFTKVEIATMLDKAYLALIAQKFTGMNQRGAAFESDSKAIEDIKNLIETECLVNGDTSNIFLINTNEIKIVLPEMLYYITSKMNVYNNEQRDNITLTSHQNAQNFINTSSNIPWINGLIGYIENKYLIIIYDSYKIENYRQGGKQDLERNINDGTIGVDIIYIKKPKMFEENIERWDTTEFELPDSVAEELITLAKIFALENIESSRLNTSMQTKQLEI